VSKEEFIAGGVEGLPSFVSYPDLGHHYDEESEYFLHHEELYHGTPETQTDESYNHPEGEFGSDFIAINSMLMRVSCSVHRSGTLRSCAGNLFPHNALANLSLSRTRPYRGGRGQPGT
jgi:hypothetical protein